MAEILRDAIVLATTAAMKARDKRRVAAFRLVNAELKRVEIDERRELVDDDVIAILNRMLKQRADSLEMFEKAGRDDLADQERFEIALVKEFMPEALSIEEVQAAIAAAIEETGAAEMRDMGKVMDALKDRLRGRADMSAVSGIVRERLSG